MSEDIKKLQLELGGSFFELIEFSLTRNIRGRQVKGVYGVNVAKVREVVRMPRINPLASRIKGVSGVFELRGIPIPAVNLPVALGDDDQEPKSAQQIIVTEFSQKRAGFIVDSTHRIRRVAWDKVLPPSADAGACMSGMTLIDGNEFLFILDLERILISLEFGTNPSEMGGAMPFDSQTATPQKSPKGPKVLLVDDSQFIRQGVRQALVRAGYQVVEAGDGAEALNVLEHGLTKSGGGFDVVVTDVEMPRMDGLSLTRRIRENVHLSHMPVILHTSLSGKANQAAGMSVGANGYVIKNDLNTLFEMMREILGDVSDAA